MSAKAIRNHRIGLVVPNAPSRGRWLGPWVFFASLVLSGASTRDARRFFEKGDFIHAEQEYLKQSANNREDLRLSYNAGVAAYRAGSFAAAISCFEAATLSPDLALQHRALYNLGNALYRSGKSTPDDAQKIQRWQTAVKQYEAALHLEASDALAEDNLEFVKQAIAGLKPPRPPPQPESRRNQDEARDPDPSGKSSGKNASRRSRQNPASLPSDDPPQRPEKSEANEPRTPSRKTPKSRPGSPKDSPASEQPPSSPSGSVDRPRASPLTPEQARRLLDTQKNEEEAMIFSPPKSYRYNRGRFKDW